MKSALGLGVFWLGTLCLCAGPATGQPVYEPPKLALPPVIKPGDPMGPSADAPIATPPNLCAPAKLFRAKIRNISPGLAASDRAAQPRVIYRQRSIFMRSEEDVDPLRGEQRVIIVAEPDVWVVNLADRTGQHTTDPGPEFVVRAPILPPAGLPPELLRLEFGCEQAFLTEFAPVPEREVAWGAERARLHRVSIGQHTALILMAARGDRPIMVSYLRDGRPVSVIRYDEYRQGLPDRPELFTPGKGVAIAEGPTPAAPSVEGSGFRED